MIAALYSIAVLAALQAGELPTPLHQISCSFDMGKGKPAASLTIEVTGDLHGINPNRVAINDPSRLLHGYTLSQAFAHSMADGSWRLDFLAGDDRTGDLLMLMDNGVADHFDAAIGRVAHERSSRQGTCAMQEAGRTDARATFGWESKPA